MALLKPPGRYLDKIYPITKRLSESSGWVGYYDGFNSLDKTAGTTLGNGDTSAAAALGNNSARTATAIPDKCWATFAMLGTGDEFVGVANATETISNYPGQTTNSWGFDGEDGVLYYNAANQFSGTICAVGDQITIARNGANLWFARNGSWFQGDPFLGTSPFVHGLTGDLYFMGPRNPGTLIICQLPTGFTP